MASSRPAAPSLPPVAVMADADRDASRDAVLRTMPPGDPWVFAYGSLMWDRGVFAFEAAESALLRGYRRSFCVWTQEARGTPQQPGLALGLEAGGACRGVAFRVARGEAPRAFDRIWRREMYTGCYRPRWLRARLAVGDVAAVTFLARRDHPQYAGRLRPEAAAYHIALAMGERGPCREYLVKVLEHLAVLGTRDRGLERLLELVDRVPPA